MQQRFLFLFWGLSIVALRSAAGGAEPFENSLGMKLVHIPPGQFMMGSPPTEKGRREDEPQRLVRITRSFEIGQFEVTRGQFRRFVEATSYRTDAERGQGGYGVDPRSHELLGPGQEFSWRNTGFEQTDDHPVVNVSWNDAIAFCAWLSKTENCNYRLPSEAQWEFACRGGATTVFSQGDDEQKLVGFGNIVDRVAAKVYPDRIAVSTSDGYVFTAPVGRFKPNGFDLYDMHGNVWEWTADWFGTPAGREQTDPRGPESGDHKVVRGGDWYHDWSFARCAQRYPIHPGLCRRHAGFRVVRDVKTSP